MSHPIVAIVGAPNVGKSTLFNRLVGHRRAIVTNEPGVTRDRLYGLVRDVRRPFRLVDTGGLTPGTPVPLARAIEQQAEAALREAAVVLLVVDARVGATALDREVASRLRRRSLSLVLVANKIDTPSKEHLVHDLHELGLGEPIPVSAEHGLGVEALLEAVESLLGEVETTDAGPQAGSGGIRVAIIGRPNVGKSSILNRLLGQQRVLVSEVPGTTRDAVDTGVQLGDGRRYVLVDTAGIRRKGKTRLAAERQAVSRARKTIERADVAVLVLDAAAGFAAQDAHIAGYVLAARKPMVIVVNKWDLVTDREQTGKRWEEEIGRRLRFAKEVPMLLASARTGQRIAKLLDHVDRLHAAAGLRIPTSELNQWLKQLADGGVLPGSRNVRLLYATQTGVHPPRFLMFCNDARHVHFSLRRHLDNSLRERFGFGAAPILLQFRSSRSA